MSINVQQVAKTSSLPKDNLVVPSLLQLLHLAVSARGMLAPAEKGGGCCIPKPEEAYFPLLRGILPSWMEVTSYLTLKAKYQAAEWKDTPKDEKTVQVKQMEASDGRGSHSP